MFTHHGAVVPGRSCYWKGYVTEMFISEDAPSDVTETSFVAFYTVLSNEAILYLDALCVGMSGSR